VSGSEDTLQSGRPTASSDATVPSGLGRYEITGTVGEGGMGRVLLARDLQFGRTVALKELKGTASADAVARFELEARVTANLEHPGVVAVYERGKTERGPYFTMRRVAGQTLADALHQADAARRLSLLPRVVQLAHTLGFAHEHGVVHRDVKPQNVVLGTHGEVVLLDWGLARLVKPGALDATPAPTIHGEVLGTPAYMAPEQARGDSSATDARTDVFALGAILFELLTGRAPYVADSVEAALDAARAGRRPPTASLARGAPEALIALCDEALSVDPAARPPSATDVARRLEAFLANSIAESASRRLRTASTVVVSIALGMVGSAVVQFVRLLPDDARAFGPAVLVSAAISAATLVLCAIEGRARGRLALLPVAEALVPMNLLLAAVFFLFGLVRSLSVLSDPAVSLSDAARPIGIGMRESMATFAVPALFTVIQMVGVAFARRSTVQRQA